jgi:hypothetical protein
MTTGTRRCRIATPLSTTPRKGRWVVVTDSIAAMFPILATRFDGKKNVGFPFEYEGPTE